MTIEDSLEKSRRNLVGFSCALIAICWLDAPISGNLLGVIEVGTIDATKGWTIALVVLLYLGLRFHSYSKVKNDREQWWKIFKSRIQLKIAQHVQESFLAWRKNKIIPMMVKFGPMPEEAVHDEYAAIDSIQTVLIDVPTNTKQLRGKISYYEARQTGAEPDGVGYIDCTVPRIIPILATIKEFWSTLILDWRFLEIGVPYALGLVALAISLSKLYCA